VKALKIDKGSLFFIFWKKLIQVGTVSSFDTNLFKNPFLMVGSNQSNPNQNYSLFGIVKVGTF
jgi:hypothetical protein